MDFNKDVFVVNAKPVGGREEKTMNRLREGGNGGLSDSVIEAIQQQTRNNSSDAAQQIIDDVLRSSEAASFSRVASSSSSSSSSSQPYTSVLKESSVQRSSYAKVVVARPVVVAPFQVDEQNVEFLRCLFGRLSEAQIRETLTKYRNNVELATDSLVKLNDRAQAVRDEARQKQGLQTEAEELAELLMLKKQLEEEEEAEERAELAKVMMEREKALEMGELKAQELAVQAKKFAEECKEKARQEQEDDDGFEIIRDDDLTGFEDQKDAERSSQKALFVHVDPDHQHRRILVSWPCCQSHASHDYVAMLVSKHKTHEDALKPENLPDTNAKGLQWSWCASGVERTIPTCDNQSHTVLNFECSEAMLPFGHVRFYYFTRDNGMYYCNAVSSGVYVGPDYASRQ